MPHLKIKMQTMVRVCSSCTIFVIFDINVKVYLGHQAGGVEF
jgi:hypothetical protein